MILCLHLIYKHLYSIFKKLIALLIHIVAPSLKYWIIYSAKKKVSIFLRIIFAFIK